MARGLTERRLHLLVLAACLLLYLPRAGSYGLWDPWETHYAEVSRQMATRGDYVALHWPGAPIEDETFASKPVLLFWMESLSMRTAGLAGRDAPPDELVSSSRPEWACRLPVMLLGVLGVWAVFWLTRRLRSPRAGAIAAAACATAPMYALMARQATTDMPFVGTMTAALAFAGVALVDGERPLARDGRPAWRAPWAIAAAAVLTLAIVPQLAYLGARMGLAFVAPYPLLAAWLVVRLRRMRDEAAVLGVLAGAMCGLAMLAKGLAGVGIPVIVVGLHALVVWRAPWKRVDLVAAALAWALVALPWYHAVIAVTGGQFFDEYILVHHFARAVGGLEGERGPFSYVLRELGYGLGVWLPVAAAAAAWAIARGRRAGRTEEGGAQDARERTGAGALAWVVVWAVVTFAVIASSKTKFHHYALPIVPAIAVLIGCFVDELLARRVARRTAAAVIVGFGLPVAAVMTLDLVRRAASAERILWMFDYDYMLGGLPWPAGHDYRAWLIAIAGAGALATIALCVRRASKAGVVALALSAALGAGFLLDVFLPRLATHWTDKQLVASYYRLRAPGEPFVDFRVFFRGETFYSQNAAYDPALPPRERAMFIGPGHADAFQRYLARHHGRRVFVLVRRIDLASVQELIEPAARASFRIVDDHHNKIVLATVTP